MYKSLLRPLLFRKDPETIHHKVFGWVKSAHQLPLVPALLRGLYKAPGREVEAFGLHFKNPIGLAAGFDKDGKLFDELANFGFGFIEVGTVTPKPQAGNPKPRMFRLAEDQALINRMGFNNEGVDALAERLKKRKNQQLIIGGNIGKNKTTPNENAVDDYLYCFEKLHELVDYFVVNVSSPNTPDLRALQDKGPLLKILKSLQEKNGEYSKPKPILLKIAPDLSEAQLNDIIEIYEESGLAGIIATNTTIDRSSLTTDKHKIETIGAGGLSGKPLRSRSTEVIKYLVGKSGGNIKVIAVGGIFTAEDAREKLAAGACLVQVYTGFIYEGPAMVKKILNKL